MFQGIQKSQFYFSRAHGCEVTVNSMWKSLFSMFWSINQLPLDLRKWSSSALGSWECYLNETYLTCHLCVVSFDKNAQTVTKLVWGEVIIMIFDLDECILPRNLASFFACVFWKMAQDILIILLNTQVISHHVSM